MKTGATSKTSTFRRQTETTEGRHIQKTKTTLSKTYTRHQSTRPESNRITNLRLSLQNEDYMGYQMINVPNQNYQTVSPEQELISNLPQVGKWSRDQNGSRAVQNVFETGE